MFTGKTDLCVKRILLRSILLNKQAGHQEAVIPIDIDLNVYCCSIKDPKEEFERMRLGYKTNLFCLTKL